MVTEREIRIIRGSLTGYYRDGYRDGYRFGIMPAWRPLNEHAAWLYVNGVTDGLADREAGK